MHARSATIVYIYLGKTITIVSLPMHANVFFILPVKHQIDMLDCRHCLHMTAPVPAAVKTVMVYCSMSDGLMKTGKSSERNLQIS